MLVLERRSLRDGPKSDKHENAPLNSQQFRPYFSFSQRVVFSYGGMEFG
jgi:hypothetical protein